MSILSYEVKQTFYEQEELNDVCSIFCTRLYLSVVLMVRKVWCCQQVMIGSNVCVCAIELGSIHCCSETKTPLHQGPLDRCRG